MKMHRRAGVYASVLLFLTLALVLPAMDYRGIVFFSGLALFTMAPMIVVVLVLLFVVTFAFSSALLCLWARRRLAALQWLGVCGAAVLTQALFIRLCAYVLVSNSPLWSSQVYEGAANALSSLSFALLAAFILGVPGVALILFLKSVLARHWRSAMLCAAVPVAGIGLNHAGSVITDLLTVNSCIPALQESLLAVKNGKTLPRESQSFPITVLRTNPDVAVESLDSVLFAPEFIAYDTADRSPEDVALRIHKKETPGCSGAAARRVWGDYYWVTDVC